MISLQQDADGFIYMSRRFPKTLTIAITFNDGSREEYSGKRLNELYDAALAAFRLGNNMDAKGFERVAAKRVPRKNAVDHVPVVAGMAQ